MINLHHTLTYYKRPEIQKILVAASKNREVAVRFGDGGFGKRPDTLTFTGDILEFVKNGATSFHFSEELWKDPLHIKQEMTPKDVKELRVGWDLVLDVDFEVWEVTKIITDSLIRAIKKHNIGSITCKFSGNKGFHIGVPFESFPEKVIIKGNLIPTRELFPEGVQRIAKYLMDYIDNKYSHFDLSKKISNHPDLLEYLKNNKKKLSDISIEVCGNKSCGNYGKHIPKQQKETKTEFICERCNKSISIEEEIKMMKCPSCKIIMKKVNNKKSQHACPFCKKNNFISKVDLKIDTLLISSRHLFRGVYSLHEKSGLASIPIDPSKVLTFSKEFANPNKIKLGNFKFLSRQNIKKGEAERLIVQAFDYSPDTYIEEKKEFSYEELKDAIPEQFFPPCIQLGFKGLSDGRKRFLFTIINFLTSVGWNYEQIEEYLKKWNKNNSEPLREVSIKGQIRYHKTQKKKILPPNCSNNMYYLDLAICKPDALCKSIKNPVSYARVKAKKMNKKK